MVPAARHWPFDLDAYLYTSSNQVPFMFVAFTIAAASRMAMCYLEQGTEKKGHV